MTNAKIVRMPITKQVQIGACVKICMGQIIGVEDGIKMMIMIFNKFLMNLSTRFLLKLIIPEVVLAYIKFTI